MAKPTPKYILVLLALLISTAVTYWVRSRPAPDVLNADLKKVPVKIGAWYSEEQPIDSNVQNVLNADSLLSRLYHNDEVYTPMGLLIVYRKYGRRDFAHRPEMCYPASGYEILNKGLITVPYGGKDIPAVKVLAEKDGQQEVVVYWFASGERTESNFAKQQLWMAMDRLSSHKYGWAFIRINAPVADTEEDTIKDIQSFVRTASNPLSRVLTGSGKTAETVHTTASAK